MAVIHLIRRIRERFLGNPLLGWYDWLEAFQDALEKNNSQTSGGLLQELEGGGYELSPPERDRLDEYTDLDRYRWGGPSALWEFHEAQLQAAEQSSDVLGQARARQHLGLLFQLHGDYAAADVHYRTSLSSYDDARDSWHAQRVRDMLLALNYQCETSQPHDLFLRLTRLVRVGHLEVAEEFQGLVHDIVESGNWRLGRQAIEALEQLDDIKSIAAMVQGAPPPVQVAAVVALRRLGPWRAEEALRRASKNGNRFVRWQAALALDLLQVCHDPEERELLLRQIAYEFWEKRGRPYGSPDVDWFRAEQELAAHWTTGHLREL